MCNHRTATERGTLQAQQQKHKFFAGVTFAASLVVVTCIVIEWPLREKVSDAIRGIECTH